MAFTAAMATVLAATGIFVLEHLRSNLDHAIDASLRVRSGDLAVLAQQSDTALRESRAAAGRSPAVAELIGSAGQIVDRTAGLPAGPLLPASSVAAARRGAVVLLDTRIPGQGPVRLLARGLRAQDQMLVGVVGQSLQERINALGGLRDVLLLGGPAALLLTSLAGYAVIGAALRPVETMRRQAGEFSADGLDQRLPGPIAHDELGRLRETLNEMLDRVYTSVGRERAFVANASHELRSPIATLPAELELVGLERPSGVALQRAVGSAIEEADRLARLADDLLVLARVDEDGIPISTESILVPDLLRDVQRSAQLRPSVRRVEIVIGSCPPVSVTGDRNLLTLALQNLVSNGVRHASTTLELRADVHEGSVRLHVLDDGPGFAADFLPEAWERFSRASAGRTEPGFGLGLAIARAVARAHRGSTHAANRAGGGADVWLSLPLAEFSRWRRPGVARASRA